MAPGEAPGPGTGDGGDSGAPLPQRDDAITVEVVYGAAPGEIDRCTLRLRLGATLADALQASGVLARCALVIDPGTARAPGATGSPGTATGGSGPAAGPSPAATRVTAGIWGREAPLTTRLRDRDRVELYRPLQVDPKEARRLRYRQQGERGRRRVRAGR